MTKQNQPEQPVSGAMTDAAILNLFYNEHGEGFALYEVTPGDMVAFARAILSSASSQDAIRNAALEEAANKIKESKLDQWAVFYHLVRSLQSAHVQQSERPDVSDFETRRAIMEGERKAACDEYFKARPQIDFIGNRRIFEAGFQRGFETNAVAPQVAQEEEAREAVNQDLLSVELAGAQSTIGHLSQRVDEAVALAAEAIELMARFHSHAEPDDTPEMNAIFPALHFRNFVDDHARLMFKLRWFNADPVDPAFLRLKKAADEVCAVLGHHGTISARDDRVQTLMDCLYATDSLKSVYAAPQTNAQQSIAAAIEYPDEWDTAAYPTLESALHELAAWHRVSRALEAESDAQQATFNVWQDGMIVASATGPRTDALREAHHYAAAYGQDGPVVVKEHDAQQSSEKGGAQ